MSKEKAPSTVTVTKPESDEFGRNLAAAPKSHVVSFGETTMTVNGARDSIEAWAIFCDTAKVSPSVKAGKVDGKRVGYESDEPAK